jgi:hypothetical protein
VARAGVVGGEPASELGQLDRHQIAALAGVAPMKRDSARFEPSIAAADPSAIISILDVQDSRPPRSARDFVPFCS